MRRRNKFGGICGSGVLLKRSRMPLETQMNGGASTTLYRSGTPALGLAASSALALQLACDKREIPLCCRSAPQREVAPRTCGVSAVHINSPEHAVPHILNLSVKNVKGTVFQRALSEKRRVRIRSKSACSADGLPSRAVFAVSRDRRKCTVPHGDQPEPPHHGRRNRRILSVFDACYAITS